MFAIAPADLRHHRRIAREGAGFPTFASGLSPGKGWGPPGGGEGRSPRRRIVTAKAARLRRPWAAGGGSRSEEHTSELQSLMRISYAVFCLKQTITLHSL